jgi:hypothetical protein
VDIVMYNIYMCTWQYPLVYIMCTYTGPTIVINFNMCTWQYPIVYIMYTYTGQTIVIHIYMCTWQYPLVRQVDIVMYTYKCYYNSLTCICTHDIDKWILSWTHINVITIAWPIDMCTWQYPLVYIMCTYPGQGIVINFYMCTW